MWVWWGGGGELARAYQGGGLGWLASWLRAWVGVGWGSWLEPIKETCECRMGELACWGQGWEGGWGVQGGRSPIGLFCLHMRTPGGGGERTPRPEGCCGWPYRPHRTMPACGATWHGPRGSC